MSPAVTAAIGAASFWIFIAIIVVAGVSSGFFRHRETQKTIRQAMESGQTLSPETLDRLLQSNRPPPPNRRGLMAGGIMLLALAGGMCLIGWSVAEQTHNPSMLFPGLGAGALIAMLGIGLLLVSLVIRDPRGDRRG